MMRPVVLGLALTPLAGCVDALSDYAREELTRARAFTYEGVPYLVEYDRFAGDLLTETTDGIAVRAYGVFERINVSRGDGGQFGTTQAERDAAIKVAAAYCKRLGLRAPERNEVTADYRSAVTGDNATWSVKGICTLPQNDPRA